MCKSILLMVICSSNLVGGNNVYAAHIDGVGYQSNVGDRGHCLSAGRE